MEFYELMESFNFVLNENMSLECIEVRQTKGCLLTRTFALSQNFLGEIIFENLKERTYIKTVYIFFETNRQKTEVTT